MRGIVRVGIVMAALAGVLHASASWAGPACTARTGAQAALGSHGSLDASQSRIETSATGGLSCQSGGGGAHGKDWVRLRLDSDDGGVLRNSANGDVLPFRVYWAKDRSVPLVVGGLVELSQWSWSGSASGADIPLYFATQPYPGLSIAAGTYTATLRVRWYWQICPGTQSAGACEATGGWDRSRGLLGRCSSSLVCHGVQYWGTGEVATLHLSMTVDSQCALNTPELAFGSAPLLSEFGEAGGQVHVRCSKGVGYTVGMSAGRNPDGQVRRMSNGSAFLAYQLYKSRGALERWGDQGGERRHSNESDLNPGLLDGLTPQVFQYRGVILPDGPSPPAGTYVDYVVVDVQL